MSIDFNPDLFIFLNNLLKQRFGVFVSYWEKKYREKTLALRGCGFGFWFFFLMRSSSFIQLK